jgi:hypothetical protein
VDLHLRSSTISTGPQGGPSARGNACWLCGRSIYHKRLGYDHVVGIFTITHSGYMRLCMTLNKPSVPIVSHFSRPPNQSE